MIEKTILKNKSPKNSFRVFMKQCAMTLIDHADAINVLFSGDADKVQHDGILTGVRALNVREIAIHTIGCKK